MRNSFVLKDVSGCPAGYLIQAGEDIRCRIDGDGMRAVVTVLFEEGESMDKETAADGVEHRWNGDLRASNGVYVSAGGVLLFSSGGNACRAFERRSLHAAGAALRVSRPEDREAEQAKDRKADAETAKQASGTESAGAVEPAFPQRRWPPPPCWPHARYAHGRWQEK